MMSRLERLDATLEILLNTPIQQLNDMNLSDLKCGPLSEGAVLEMLAEVREVLMDEPMVLQIDCNEATNDEQCLGGGKPIFVCASPHAELGTMRHILCNVTRFLQRVSDEDNRCRLLVMGNFSERGRHPVFVTLLCLALKVRYPQQFFLVRGKHECAAMARIHGNFDDFKRRYNIRMWKRCMDAFNCMPVAAVIGSRILCLSRGPSPEVKKNENIIDLLMKIDRPTGVPATGLLCDILWSELNRSIEKWSESDRGVSYDFGIDVLKEFFTHQEEAAASNNGHSGADGNTFIDKLITGCCVVDKGYQVALGKKYIGLWGYPVYLGTLDNLGALAAVNTADLSVQIMIFDELTLKAVL